MFVCVIILDIFWLGQLLKQYKFSISNQHSANLINKECFISRYGINEDINQSAKLVNQVQQNMEGASLLQSFKQDKLNSLEKRLQFHLSYSKSLRQDFYVLAKNPELEKWRKGIIVAVRPSKNYFSQTIKEENYQYYIRFKDQDKRNDCWISSEYIKQSNQPVLQVNCCQVTQILNKEHPNDNPHYGLNAAQLDIHEKATKIRTIERVRFGQFETKAWYYSPYPPMYQNLNMLYICEYCFSPFSSVNQLKRHDNQCPYFYPPGNQIYRDTTKNISVFQVDGVYSKTYAQNLGYFSKMFLDHKCLYLAMKHFIFYILCEYKDQQFHVVGYFSKCIQSSHNLSCILVLPFYQKKGYGKFLVNFSYQLSLVDKKKGSPEKPLSDLGRKLYLSYWVQKIIEILEENQTSEVSIQMISRQTAIQEEDIRWAISKCSFLKLFNEKVIAYMSEKSEGQINQIIGIPVGEINREKLHYVSYFDYLDKKKIERSSRLNKSKYNINKNENMKEQQLEQYLTKSLNYSFENDNEQDDSSDISNWENEQLPQLKHISPVSKSYNGQYTSYLQNSAMTDNQKNKNKNCDETIVTITKSAVQAM